MKRLITFLTLALPLGLALGACDSSTGADTGTVSLLLTDAPGDVLEAWVTIDRIYLQPGEDEGNESARVDLMTDDVTVDLITLADEIEGLVEGVAVPTGVYNQLRVVVSGACLVVEGEAAESREVYATPGFTECGAATGSLQTTSLGQTGIKVQLPGGGVRVTGGQHILLLDFDVRESFGHQAGQSGMWVMNPVIRGSEIGLTSSLTVSLTAADSVVFPEIAEGDTLSLGHFLADLSTEEVDRPFTDEDGDGVYTATFEFLVPDPDLTYEVTVRPQDGVTGFTFTFDPATAEVTLTGGAASAAEFTLTRIQPAS